ncbi:MAG TPA: tRNA (adenosine(37)-N6)-threonylcarbamoyltransferase complex transferase subunit TsaD [Thermodesulfobacteriota bacterium]
MIVLGVETSCDETAAAVVEGGRVRSSVVASQVELHGPWGGVVPELASRRHLEAVLPVMRAAVERAGLSGFEAIEGVAVTQGPGLVGALLVGLAAAKGFAYARRLPFVGVHHHEAHLHAIRLEYPDLGYPFVGLLVSGGHTSLHLAEGLGRYRLLGRTVDDAAGEAFDKGAKLLGLGYPGGAVIDRLARGGDPARVRFPRARLGPPTGPEPLDFSFSGLKTALRQRVERGEVPARETPAFADLVAGFQEAIVEPLVDKAMQATRDTGVRRLVAAGGVAANSRLRGRLSEACAREGVALFIPSLHLCTDNAAMVAGLGEAYFAAGRRSGWDADARPDWRL